MFSRYVDNFDFSSRFRILKGGKISLVVSAILGSVIISHAAPIGGVVTSGNATIAQSGNTTNITQSTQKASINWQGFSINSNETVNFKQPNVNSITLNRVVGNERSVIDGALNANGQVWILNSNGILFNSTAKINTAGILATTKDISDADFQAGNYKFSGDSTASVVNMGTIEASDNGYVALLANTVQNDGTIKAYKGTVHLTGASEATINLNGNSIVSLTVNKGVLDALVENKGAVIADGGKIYLTTNAVDELLKGVVNNTGVLEANSIDDVTGHVEVFAHGGTANVSGTIEAIGGFIETSGKNLSVADGTVIKAKKWLLDPENVVIESTGGSDIAGGSVSASAIETALISADIEIQATNDITVNQAINIYTVDNSGYTVGGLTLTAGNDININNIITVGPEAYLVLNHGWNGEIGAGATYGNGGKITFGMNADKTDFVGKVAFAPNVNTPGFENSAVYINDVEQNIIRTAEQLQFMNTYKIGNYVLANDIDLDSVTWTPIGDKNSNGDNYNNDFKGTFNGLGHTISNLTLNGEFKYTGETHQAAGLFGNIAGNANISGVKLANAVVTNTATSYSAPTAALVGSARDEYNNGNIVGTPTIHNNIVTTANINSTNGGDVGAIVGSARNTTISGNVVLDSRIISQKSRVGGIVGKAESSTILDSFVALTMIGSTTGGEAGGIAGYIKEGTIIDNATVTDSLIAATIYGAGGIVGASDEEDYDSDEISEIKNSSVDTSIILAGQQDAGGIIGSMYNTKITNSFYDLGTTQIGTDVDSSAPGVITYGGIYSSEYSTWLTGNKATLTASSLLGAAVDGYYSIDDVSDFRKMLALAYEPANKFKLASSFTLDSGLYLPVLRGELDGNNFTLSNLNVSQSYNSHIGLVGRLEGGTVKNLILNSATLDGYANVGGIAGSATQNDDGTKSPTISNVTVNGFNYSHTKEFDTASNGIDTNVYNIGAIAGKVENATLSNLTASGNIAVNLITNNEGDEYVDVETTGGLLGKMENSTFDTASSSVAIDIDVLVKAATSNNGDNYSRIKDVGGLIGYGYGNSLVKNVSSTGAIDIKSVAEKTVSTEDDEGDIKIDHVAGLFGEMSESYIKNATSTNTITIETNDDTLSVGGLAGYTYASIYDTATTSGLIIIKESSENEGLEDIESIGGAFGYASGSILKDVDSTRNITVEGSSSGDVERIGGLVGNASSTNISSSSYTGTIDINDISEAYSVGGLVGRNSGYIEEKNFASFNKTIDASVSTEDKAIQRAALLASYNLREDVIALKALGYEVNDNSWGNNGQDYYVSFRITTPENTEWGVIKDSTVSVNIKAQNAENVGGLVGKMDAEDGGQIINSSVTALESTSKVEGSSNVGGLVGYNYAGNITNSHATINVKANSTDEANVGGLVGYNEGAENTEYLDVANISTFNTTTYQTPQDALMALTSVKEAYINSLKEANPDYQYNESDSDIFVSYNGTSFQLSGRPEFIKSQVIGTISNSYATGAVTSTGSNIGGLVGRSELSNIEDSYATGAVTGTGSSSARVGGLVGSNEGSTIADSYASGNVAGARGVGGLVGYNDGYESDALITDSYATGAVSGIRLVGGLVGYSFGGDADGIISNSYATGAVSGDIYIGGLVGSNENYGDGDAIIENSYATGAVSGTTNVGGLTGGNEFYGAAGVVKILNSYATGTISGTTNVGGLVGNGLQSTIETSYAKGNVTGTNSVGGLVGFMQDSPTTILNSYAVGNVVGTDSVGGLVGFITNSTVTNTYASGAVTGTINVGGLLGQVTDTTVNASFYNSTKNPNVVDNTYGMAKTTAEMNTLATYTTDLGEAAWDIVEDSTLTKMFPQFASSESIWKMNPVATIDPGTAGSVTPTPTPEPTPTPTLTPTPIVNEINKVITTIVNAQQVDVKLPNFVTDLNIVNNINAPSVNNNSIILNSPIQNNSFTNQLFSQLNIAEGQSVSLVSTPIAGLASEKISMNELGALSSNPSEVRVSLGNGSIVELLNGGVTLPEGVQQEFYVQKTESKRNKGAK